MRTYRSSQLSYCPTKNVSINIHRYGKKARGIPFFFRKRLNDRVPIAGFPGKTCTANLYRLGKIAFLPEKVMFRAFFRIEAHGKCGILDSRTGFRTMRTHPGPVFGISAADEIQKRGDFFRRRRSDAAVRPELVRRRHRAEVEGPGPASWGMTGNRNRSGAGRETAHDGMYRLCLFFRSSQFVTSGGFSHPCKVRLERFSVVAFSGRHTSNLSASPFCPSAENPSARTN